LRNSKAKKLAKIRINNYIKDYEQLEKLREENGVHNYTGFVYLSVGITTETQLTELRKQVAEYPGISVIRENDQDMVVYLAVPHNVTMEIVKSFLNKIVEKSFFNAEILGAPKVEE
jgi:glucose-6-phosphate 1-dehydrogenase